MRILFIANNVFESNSCYHTRGFAKGLASAGHQTAIALPALPKAPPPNEGFGLLSFEELGDQQKVIDTLGGPPDIIHAWTARDHVLLALLKFLNAGAATVIHLEDPEDHVTDAYEKHWQQNKRRDLDALRWKRMVASESRVTPMLGLVDGATVIMPTLREKVPAEKPCLDLLPVLDASFFAPEVRDDAFLASLGIGSSDTCIVSYTGSQGPVNRSDMVDLYTSIHLLRKRGIPCRLLRTGISEPDFLESLPFDAQEFSVEMGFVERERLLKVLAAADFLIQPGRNDEWNRYRFPSKIPEFLLMGKAVIMPDCHAVPGMQDGVHALLSQTGTPEELAALAARLHSDRELRRSVEASGRGLALELFEPANRIEELVGFYRSLIQSGGSPGFAHVAQQLNHESDIHKLLRVCLSFTSDLSTTSDELFDALQESSSSEKKKSKQLEKALLRVKKLESDRANLRLKLKGSGPFAKLKRLLKR